MPKYKLLIIDDHQIFRKGVAEFIDQNKFEIVSSTGDAKSAARLIREKMPDVVLIDVHLGDGILAADVIIESKRYVKTNFLAISVSDSYEDVGSTIRAGAKGYITKTATKEELNMALEQVALGSAVFSPKLASFVIEAFQTEKAAEDETYGAYKEDEDYNRLSLKQRETLQLIARGYSYKEIAKEMFVTTKTIEAHVSAVLKKLQLSNRNEITLWAAKRKMI